MEEEMMKIIYSDEELRKALDRISRVTEDEIRSEIYKEATIEDIITSVFDFRKVIIALGNEVLQLRA